MATDQHDGVIQGDGAASRHHVRQLGSQLPQSVLCVPHLNGGLVEAADQKNLGPDFGDRRLVPWSQQLAVVGPDLSGQVVAETVGVRGLAAPPAAQQDRVARVDGGGSRSLHTGILGANLAGAYVIPEYRITL